MGINLISIDVGNRFLAEKRKTVDLRNSVDGQKSNARTFWNTTMNTGRREKDPSPR
jgi:hypothetical protein